MELLITAKLVTGQVTPVKMEIKSTSEVLQVPFRNSCTVTRDAAGLMWCRRHSHGRQQYVSSASILKPCVVRVT